MAFGTGDHPTTSMCLKAIEKYVKAYRFCDRCWNRLWNIKYRKSFNGVKRIKALDIDEMAVNVAKENFKKNHCENAIEAVQVIYYKMKIKI